jgi:transposase
MVIARFAMATNPEIRPLPDEATRFLNNLVCRRRQIIEMIVAEKQCAMRLSNKRLQQSIARLIKALEKELASFDTDIAASPAWREKEDLLISVPGVGKGTARTLLAVVSRAWRARRPRGRINRRLCAFHPPIRPLERQELYRRWPPRSARFLSALVAVRHNPQMKSFYERLVGAGKAKMVALIAVARKLAVLLNAILKP